MTKNLYPPIFYEITTSSFQEVFHDIFNKFCQKKNYKNKIITKKKNHKKAVFFIFSKLLPKELLKYIKEHFLKV